MSMLAHSFLIESSSKLLVTRTGIRARISSISGLWFPWPIYMFFEMRFDLGTLDSGERSLLLGYLFIRSFSNLQVMRTGIKSRTSSNFGQIGPLPTELSALDRLKNFP